MLEYETVMKSCLPGPCAMVEGPIVFIYSGCPGPGKNSWIPDGYKSLSGTGSLLIRLAFGDCIRTKAEACWF